ncbi:MAG: RNA polymerase sigma-70 factor [Balneolales bacterium]
MHSLDNKDFIQGLRSGDKNVFEEVYLRYQRSVYGMAYRYLRDKELAEDAVQDVFIKLWHHRKSLDHEKSIQGFLFKVLKNHVLNMIKSDKRRIIRNYEYICHTKNEGENPEGAAIESDYDRLLEKGSAKLPPKKRDVFNLKRLQGFSNKEIAVELGLSDNTVKSHLHWSRKFIRTYLAKNSDYETF